MSASLSKPLCQVCSPFGFAESTMYWHENVLLPWLEQHLRLIYNWRIDTRRISEAPTPAEQIERSTDLGLVHLRAVERCHLIIALLDQEPPDNGTVVELTWAAARGIPVIAYRNDFRTTSGEAGNPYNLMIMAAVRESGGFHVGTFAELQKRLPGFLGNLDVTSRPIEDRRHAEALAWLEQGVRLPAD